ncbi:JAB domain-containing protein [Candidatus Deianiraea vastatrix]|uniref:RadC family protein n=1 Tax=Candidatus Deianiraea vastatrix TaxID=2163644 RepID=A0A5B8XE61_9RICK|nr:JAB domain-containing protein [Candidatus Deianiraea vastatrix]QED23553.1 Putative RadC family protein [Candidatus Deianiraea vastatrix]
MKRRFNPIYTISQRTPEPKSTSTDLDSENVINIQDAKNTLQKRDINSKNNDNLEIQMPSCVKEMFMSMLAYIDPTIEKNDLLPLLNSKSSVSKIIFDLEQTSFAQSDEKIKNAVNIIKNFIDLLLQERIQNKNIMHVWNDLSQYLKIKFGEIGHEVFIIFYLDAKYQIIKEEQLSIGFSDKVGIDIKKIIKQSSTLNAKNIAIIHNHPSGNPNPSAQDMDLTYEISKLLAIVGIEIFDHAIVSGNEIFSFRKNYLL